MNCEDIECYYDYIDFEKSDIRFYSIKTKEQLSDIRLKSMDDLHRIIEANGSTEESVRWQAETVVMNSNFNAETDIFRLPLFSQRTYVSKRLIQNMYGAGITGVYFSEVVTKHPGLNTSGQIEIIIKGPLG